MIKVLSFEEWDKLQDLEKQLEWGSVSRNGTMEAIDNIQKYKDAPIQIKKSAYQLYIYEMTNPK